MALALMVLGFARVVQYSLCDSARGRLLLLPERFWMDLMRHSMTLRAKLLDSRTEG